MASPPYQYNPMSALSPPYPSNAQLPQPLKRRQSDMPSSAPSVKRPRKTSMLSTASGSSHPLRQTSFPPPEATSGTPQYSRSPSIDTMSLVSGVSATKKKRGRKSKNKANDDESLVGGRAKSAVSGNSARGKRGRRNSRQESVEEDEEEAGAGSMALSTVARTNEERQREAHTRAMLTRQFDEEQGIRFAAWRSAKLSDATVRRIVNQTLSQSAPVSVISAIKAAAKVYIGDIIEGARRVQTQWLEHDEDFEKLNADIKTKYPTPPAEEDAKRRPPLNAEHFVEALRRHKMSQQGALTGELGLWQIQQGSGVERFGVRVGGKRLLK